MSILLEKYKNAFDLDGRLHPQLGVTPAKVKAVQTLLEKALAGDIIADATLREAVTTSDAQFNVAHLINLQFIPQLDKIQKSIDGLVTFRTVPDFRPAVLQSIYGDLTGPGLDQYGAPVPIPEGTPFPKVTVKGVESFYSSLRKRGLRFDFTWEAKVNDTVGFFEGLPDQLLQLTDDAQYAEVFTALLMASKTLPSVTLPDGTVVPANAAASANGILAAIQALSVRTINGRKIGTLAGYNVIVPTGQKMYVEYAIRKAQSAISIQPSSAGGTAFSAATLNELYAPLSTITVIESDRVTGTNWYLVPKPNTTKGRPVLELARLRGYETPELRVQNNQGTYIGGARINPFEGSFDADTVAYRYRYVVGGILWDDTWIVKSTGAGS